MNKSIFIVRLDDSGSSGGVLLPFIPMAMGRLAAAMRDTRVGLPLLMDECVFVCIRVVLGLACAKFPFTGLKQTNSERRASRYDILLKLVKRNVVFFMLCVSHFWCRRTCECASVMAQIKQIASMFCWI